MARLLETADMAEGLAWCKREEAQFREVPYTLTPDEIAEGIAWLLLGPCRWVNGIDVPIDKGYSAGIEGGWVDFAQSPVMRARAAAQNR